MKLKLLTIVLVVLSSALSAQQSFIINHNHTDLSQIPDNWIDSAKKNLKIMYYRRSHGSQLDVGGMTALTNYSTAYADKYSFNTTGDNGALKLVTKFLCVDYDSPDIFADTRAFLDNPDNSDINVVMWAWSFEFYNYDVQAYLDTVESFIADYGPNGTKIQAGVRTVPVTFVFQTACSLETDAQNQPVYEKNQTIRNYCIQNNKILFDFNDIETYNPDGIYFGDGNADGSYSGLRRLGDDITYNKDDGTRGNWGIEWNTANPDTELAQLSDGSVCVSCPHSDGASDREQDSRLHCVLKGRAAWWLWAKLAGWEAKSVQIEVQIALTENNLDGQQINLTLNGESFTDNVLETGNFSLNNSPAGLTVSSITYIDATHATINLAFDGTDFDTDITDFNITVNNTELVGTEDLTSNNLNIDAFDEQMNINPETELTETNLDDGIINIDLTDVQFSFLTTNWMQPTLF